MGKKVKVVFDTNVWISIAMEKILKDKFLQAKQELTVYVSNEIILEISKVLLYPRIAEILKQIGIREKEILRVLLANCRMITPKVSLHVNEDAEDNRILECAVASGADIIVSGDKHLSLKLGKFRKTRILSPREFFDNIKRNQAT